MASWETIQSLLLFLGPLLLPRVIAAVRSLRNPTARSTIRPLSPAVSRALTLLFLSGLVFLLTTLPAFHPENIFRRTHSRLQTSAGVLLTRLAALRPIQPTDEALRTLFDEYPNSLEPRLLYARYGPSVVLSNPLAGPADRDAGWYHLLFALPAHLLPHIAHLVVLGLATARSLGDARTATWRTSALLAGLALAAVETYLLATYDDSANRRAVRAAQTDFLYWKILTWRGVAAAAVDALLGWAMWAHATGRRFQGGAGGGAEVAEERLRAHGTALELLLRKARGFGVLRNATVREPNARRRAEAYWVREGEVMKQVMEQPEVLEAQRNALRRMDIVRIEREATEFIDGLFAPAPPGGQASGNQ